MIVNDPLWSLPRSLRIPLLSSLLIGLIMGLSVTALQLTLQPVVPLHYSLAEPNALLVNKLWLFVFPTTSLIITCSHALMLYFQRATDLVLLKLFIWATLLVQVVLAMALVRIMFLVI